MEKIILSHKNNFLDNHEATIRILESTDLRSTRVEKCDQKSELSKDSRVPF